MKQHTPGPWEILYNDPEEEYWVTRPHYDAGPAKIVYHIEDARLIAAAPDLLEACQTFSEWLRREDEGFAEEGRNRKTPEGEAAWREWYYENLRICRLAQDQVKAAIAKATGDKQ
jgi:hypothetical protein